MTCKIWTQFSVGCSSIHVKDRVDYLLGDSINTLVFLDPLGWLRIIFCKFFSNVWTDVSPAFLQNKNQQNFDQMVIK